MKYLIAVLLIILVSCNPKKEPVKNTADTIAVQQPVQKNLTEPLHADDGKPYFDFTLSKNGKAIVNVLSDKPVFIANENGITVMLDSSHHMFTNGDMLNLYIIGKTAKTYPVTGQSNVKDSASMILTFANPSAELPLFSPKEGKIIVTQINAEQCSGTFESSSKEANGDAYLLKGMFLHAKFTY